MGADVQPLYKSQSVPVRCNGCEAAGAAHVTAAAVALIRPPKGWYMGYVPVPVSAEGEEVKHVTVFVCDRCAGLKRFGEGM